MSMEVIKKGTTNKEKIIGSKRLKNSMPEKDRAKPPSSPFCPSPFACLFYCFLTESFCLKFGDQRSSTGQKLLTLDEKNERTEKKHTRHFHIESQ
ncbi:hypothetical protein GWI33_003322 [Rhynchophorus ferrugineus]|uniref:Uncharacterized protein n=1 Tax=Rhynchophorus ferrugineus TaxID=354439 RepID=A0A834MF42_RHYFE|nr:hypothetical protein GWI33_003322 [Rhynchophorus ferrugineus]